MSRSEEASEENTDEEMDCEAGTRERAGLRTHFCRHRARSHYTNWLGVTADIQANWTRIQECERGHARMSHGTGETETALLTENISPLCRLSMLALSVIMALSAAVCPVLCWLRSSLRTFCHALVKTYCFISGVAPCQPVGHGWAKSGTRSVV